MKKNFLKSLVALVASATFLANTSVLADNSVYAKNISSNKSYNVTQLAKSKAGTTIPRSTLEKWGLGEYESEHISNNKPYSWYIDQGNTGAYSNNNCGPSSTTMALKWYNSNFSKTAEDARNTYLEGGGWWRTTDVTNYLSLNNAKYSVIENSGENLLKSTLKRGNIVILCIDTSYLSYNDNPQQRVGRFYDYEGGHFIVVKGYIVVDGKTYFETYDPNNWDETYSDGQPKGQDRYYADNELMNGISNWWNYLIVVNNNTASSRNSFIENNNMMQNKANAETRLSKIKVGYGK
ncbi:MULTISPECIES: C39 family peptidase [Clostridium]|uniref:C39 family peptidase n=1 Tax=Clostridium TaxID=1485 RepID=UPI0008247602|nr:MULTISPECIES: C39 family peptidase [Clostridium]PJI08757.1 hypothetical protein CUB90_13160 [Clostridium sp. CT7]